MTKPAWQLYYEEFERRAARVPEQRFDRDDAFSRAAHDAYRATADHLSREEHWDDDRTLVVTHAFGQTVKDWIRRGDHDFALLREALRACWRDWSGEAAPGADHPS